MPSRQARSLPSLFLMTDERMGDALWRALERLPRGAGVVFRHYRLSAAERRALFEQVRVIARRRGLLLLLAGPERLARAWAADGVHGPSPHHLSARPLLRTAPAHDRPAWIAGRRRGCDLLFVSPLFSTRSHPGASALGMVRTGLMLGPDRDRAVALGGMTHRRARSCAAIGIRRWAAIDAWTGADA
ncbi:thiamine phosphate synthase [Sphingomonas sp. PR090111-T3T-6A]|uniref:thiamine phosphate synthase n=1 Tax=Sphingomonas sp. PR090111-T3T-6A TaxID=685778 RepID=UPI0003765913|nr:thiamine phosphate synthase [Sphingomonas sp. PR090111-T3T-6A]